jgi:hypothetical protein
VMKFLPFLIGAMSFAPVPPKALIHVFVLPSGDLNRGRHLHRSLFSGIAVIA